MEMEVIKPYKSLINGNLAFKEGDWNFSKPCHWYFSKKILKPISLNTNKSVEEFKIRNNNACSDKEWVFRSGIRRIPSPNIPEHMRYQRRGLKKLEPHYTEPKTYKTHINSQPHVFIEEKIRCSKQFPQKWVKQSFEPIEADIHKPAKKRVKLTSQYLFKSVEYEPQFFKQEGWVVGSTNNINFKRYAPQNNTTFKSLDLGVKNLKLDKFYTVRESKNLLQNDLDYVNKLHDWDEKHFLENK
jgi:hypothetical protein